MTAAQVQLEEAYMRGDMVQRARIIGSVIYGLTMAARDLYDSSSTVRHPLWMVNEMVHRLSSFLWEEMAGVSGRRTIRELLVVLDELDQTVAVREALMFAVREAARSAAADDASKK